MNRQYTYRNIGSGMRVAAELSANRTLLEKRFCPDRRLLVQVESPLLEVSESYPIFGANPLKLAVG